jgi:hypothetical protein
VSTGLRLGFSDWARAHVHPCTPAELTRYFADRGVAYTKEFWRKLLAGQLRAVRLETWVRICDATGEPLATFIAYEPDGRPPTPRPRREKQKRRPERAPALALPAPPNPRDYYPEAR